MKHLIFSLVASLLMLPSLASANGEYLPGTVRILNNGTYIAGGYNVRHNPAVSKGKIMMAGGASGVTITGTDSTTGAGFYCYVPTSLLAAAEKILYAANNGVYVIATRAANGYSECTSVQMQAGSHYLD